MHNTSCPPYPPTSLFQKFEKKNEIYSTLPDLDKLGQTVIPRDLYFSQFYPELQMGDEAGSTFAIVTFWPYIIILHDSINPGRPIARLTYLIVLGRDHSHQSFLKEPVRFITHFKLSKILVSQESFYFTHNPCEISQLKYVPFVWY